jgi:circadian clock protein KaiB
MTGPASGTSGGDLGLRLSVTGHSLKSIRALANLQCACAHWLPGRYHIEVVDLLENPRLAADDQIVAVPTLVKKHPLLGAR